MSKYLIIIEKAEENYAIYSPDLPGCVATGSTRKESEENMQIAIEMHLKGLAEDGLPIPKPESKARYLEIASV